MMKRSRGKAIILSAGQGRRLLPYTANVPKCLVEVAGRTVLEWQLRALKAAGIGQVAIVVGFEADKVEAHVARHCPFGLEVRTLFNPRFAQADNLISCLSARDEMDGDFLLLNGDTLFEPTAISRLRESERAPVAVAVATKDAYDADDMKVSCKGVLVTQIDKQVPPDRIDGEAIGISLFRDRGPQRFVEALEQFASEPGSHRLWYLSAVNLLARQGLVRAAPVDDVRWAEIDYPADLERAESLVSYWENRRIPDEEPLAVRETA